VVAKEIAFLTSCACYIRFKEPDAVAHEIPENMIIRFFKRTLTFYVYGSTNGTLYAWIEG